MTESLIAPSPNPQGAPDDVAPPSSRNEGPDQQATSDAAALLYRGPEAEAAEPAEPDAPPAPDTLSGEQAPVAYEPFQLPQGVDVDTAALEEAQSLFAEARLSQPQAQKLVDLYAGKMNELVQRQISAAQDRQKAWVAEVRAIRNWAAGGSEQARAAAQKALNRFGARAQADAGRALGRQQPAALPLLRPRRTGRSRRDSWVGARSSAGRLSAAETLYPTDTPNNFNDK